MLSWAEQLPGSHPELAQVDHTLQLWDAENGDPIATLEGHTDQVNGATSLPDGRVLSWSCDMTLRIWDIRSRECKAVLEGHTDEVNGATVLDTEQILSNGLGEHPWNEGLAKLMILS